MIDFLIRQSRNEDVATLVEIHVDSRRQVMPWLPMLHSREDEIAYFAEVLLREQVWVAQVSEMVVGFIALDGSYIDHLYVAPAHQGQGIGDKLLKMAKKLHPDGLTLWTFQRNLRARRFYEGRGFIAAEFTDGSRNEEREPDVLYAWSPRAPNS